MDTHSIIVYVKSENIFADLAGDVKKISDTPNYEIKRPLPIEKKDQIDERLISCKTNERVCRHVT